MRGRTRVRLTASGFEDRGTYTLGHCVSSLPHPDSSFYGSPNA